MHCFPFKKVKKTQPNSGTGFFYVAPGYKLSMEEIHKVQSKNFNTNSYAEELRCKELFALRKLPPKSIDKSKISRPHPLHPPQNNVVLHYDNHIWLYRKHINSLQLDNHLRKWEEKRRASELAIWRYNERNNDMKTFRQKGVKMKNSGLPSNALNKKIDMKIFVPRDAKTMLVVMLIKSRHSIATSNTTRILGDLFYKTLKTNSSLGSKEVSNSSRNMDGPYPIKNVIASNIP
ncbi:hypothetical protein AMATHDRAFT_9261 [Amanita thiersii Skay4041]|uniref:Uncharacterized protein n=1 Tax=Amanita thiersii Skay4041 TaxID=703135 RepID=A0A2A9N6P9_9AGAR|nr:hypothetical protein AMATHDRAFT_9261 [Amanita thiersii Skay4041]